jgi:hypothetical protein
MTTSAPAKLSVVVRNDVMWCAVPVLAIPVVTQTPL